MSESTASAETEDLKSLIISATSALWEDKEALGTFLGVVRRSPTWAKLADTLESNPVRPAKPSFYGVQSREFQE
ncbi:hypothetical protein ACI1MP_37175 (plasmid) [Kitasatospora griseola]|uniref:hypothetical protein n=1 Tax=Kitasatospora griseola TaxID=2064 RepID=UPI0038560DDD